MVARDANLVNVAAHVIAHRRILKHDRLEYLDHFVHIIPLLPQFAGDLRHLLNGAFVPSFARLMAVWTISSTLTPGSNAFATQAARTPAASRP